MDGVPGRRHDRAATAHPRPTLLGGSRMDRRRLTLLTAAEQAS